MKIIPWTPFENIIAGTTLRQSGVSTGSLSSLNLALNVNDDIEHVIKNREIFANYFNTDFNHIISPTQTHSTNFKKVSIEDGGKGMYDFCEELNQTDALYTRDENLFLLTYHADCTPILIYDCKEHLIASIHAGWKGNVNGIVLKTVRHLIENEHCLPENMYAYIGPCLGYEAFEAKDDIIDLVKQMEINTTPYYKEVSSGVYRLDAKGLTKEQLTYLGIPASHITIDPNCTKSDPENFFSFRYDRACGRHVSFICMKNS